MGEHICIPGGRKTMNWQDCLNCMRSDAYYHRKLLERISDCLHINDPDGPWLPADLRVNLEEALKE